MYFKVLLLILLWFGWTNLSLFFLTINLLITTMGKRIFATFCSDFADKYNEMANSFKIELFKDLNDMKKGETISILEVGAGPGANFKYYNRKAIIQAVEPNHHFESKFNENKAKFENLDIKKMKIGFGEDLAAAGIEDDSVDAVVVTIVLCSVKDQQKCLQEIKRVLKPGGKFFFMEHIADDENSNILMLQKVFTQCGFWPFCFDGCCIDRTTDVEIEKAGFNEVVKRKYTLPFKESSSMFIKIVGTFFKRHVMGVATN